MTEDPKTVRAIFRVPIEYQSMIGSIKAHFAPADIGYSFLEDTNNRENEDCMKARITTDSETMELLKTPFEIEIDDEPIMIDMGWIEDLEE